MHTHLYSSRSHHHCACYHQQCKLLNMSTDSLPQDASKTSIYTHGPGLDPQQTTQPITRYHDAVAHLKIRGTRGGRGGRTRGPPGRRGNRRLSDSLSGGCGQRHVLFKVWRRWDDLTDFMSVWTFCPVCTATPPLRKIRSHRWERLGGGGGGLEKGFLCGDSRGRRRRSRPRG